MKKSFTLIAFVFAAGLLQAQINRSDLPMVGDAQFYTGLDTLGIVEGPGGMGQTWDFSGATLNNTTGTVEWVDPATHPQNGAIPGANLTRVDPNGNYIYYSIDSDSMVVVGEQSITTQPCAYTIQPTILRFPTTFGTMYTDSINGEYFDGFITNVTRFGRVNVTVDATGTLITPTTTWNNVTRIFKQFTYQDSSWTGAAISDILLFRYEWYAAGRTTPIFFTNTRLVSLNQGPFTEEREVWWADTTAVSLDQSLSATEVKVSPNPTMGRATLSYNLPSTSDVEVGIYNLVGAQVQTAFTGEQVSGVHRLNLDLSTLSKGVYFVRLRAGDSVKNRKLIVQ
ncbi:MAG: T9SS type A sorting domain-containing protein [Bacteroidota bacterium]